VTDSGEKGQLRLCEGTVVGGTNLKEFEDAATLPNKQTLFVCLWLLAVHMPRRVACDHKLVGKQQPGQVTQSPNFFKSKFHICVCNINLCFCATHKFLVL